MKNYTQLLFVTGFTLIFLLSVSSCMKNLETDNLAYGDALIRAYWDGDSVIYNTELYTYSWSEMKTVTAYSTDNTEQIFSLSHHNYLYTFSYIPNRSTYSTTAPSPTQYNFNVILENGLEYTALDYLTSVKIDPPVISELLWDETFKRINTTWSNVKNADYYRVVLLNEEEEIVFDTNLLNTSTTSLAISAYSNGWDINQQPSGNNTYKLIVYAYLFEPLPSTFDIQCIAVNDLNIIEWMPE